MNANHAAVMPSAPIAMSPTRPVAIILTNVGDVPAAVARVSANRLILRVAGHVQLSGTVRMAITHTGMASGTVRCLTRVVSSRMDDAGRLIGVELLALHTVEGTEVLADFIAATLKLGRPDTASFTPGFGGHYYYFRQTAGVTQRPTEEPQTAAESNRREPRIAVRVKVAFKLEFTTYKGRAYNISSNGIYIASDAVLPRDGEVVQVVYPVAIHAKPVNLQLGGRVCWVAPGMTSSKGGGFGVLIETFNKEDDGALWAEYVRREMSFGNIDVAS